MDVLHTNNNCRGQSDILRRPFKSGPCFVHSLTSASPFQITVVRSIFKALQIALPRRQFKSKPNHLHSLTLRKFTIDSVVACSFFQALQSESRHAYAAACSGTDEQSGYVLGEPFRLA
jgi:hypothetical protein